MEYASQKYLDRYINELPKTFNPESVRSRQVDGKLPSSPA